VAEPIAIRVWSGRGLYLAIAAGVIFVRLLPLDSSPGELPAPDLLLAVTAAWVLRRPAHVPVGLIALVFLVCDMLFLRPPGLWTLLVVLATEFLRAREGLARELTFPLEWALVAGVLIAATLAESVVLALFLAPSASIGVALLHTLVTLLAYPAVVVALRFGLGLRRAAPGETDVLGKRL
jgi:rod shape-determining protein MreD